MASRPDQETEARDQAEFDEAVAGTARSCSRGSAGRDRRRTAHVDHRAEPEQRTQHSNDHERCRSRPRRARRSSRLRGGPTKAVSLKVIPAGKLGPDKIKHDAFTKTEFAVKVGQKLDLKIDNTDEGEHSITSPEIGVNIIVKPGVHTYEIVVKEKGRFSWFCVIPCDNKANGWAMQHAGYMCGYITAT